jgi:predicted RNase H-like HicB family nuclease
MKYKIIIKPGEANGYVAECPAIPGCVSQGRTKQETLKNIKDAMNGCLQVLNERAERDKKLHRNHMLYEVAV